MNHYRVQCNARLRGVFKREGWRQQTQYKRMARVFWRARFGRKRLEINPVHHTLNGAVKAGKQDER